jgi:hypothetical protein
MKYSKVNLLLLAAVLAALLVSVGCGSSGSDSSSSSSSDGSSSESAPLAKAEFIKRADAICKKTEAERTSGIKAFYKKVGANPEKALVGKQGKEMVFVAIVPPLEKQAEELRALGVPNEKAAKAIMVEFDEALAAFKKLSESGKEETKDPFSAVNQHSRKYGFKTCNNFL